MAVKLSRTMREVPMSEPTYEYYGLKATTWDLLRGDTSGWADRAFFRDLIARHGEPVLDVGCGAGRLLLDYLAAGIDIDGVDNSPEMLALCREKAARLDLRPALHEQQMEALDLPRRYRTLLVPSSSFQLLTDAATARAAMNRFVAHLAPGGALVMPFMLLWQEGEPLTQDWKLLKEIMRPEDGALIRRWSRVWYDPDGQLEHTEDRYEVVRDGQAIASELHRRSPATRSYTQDQARQLYADAGLADIRLCSQFGHEPATPDDTIFTAFGIRP